jgi:hypothetical protein
LTPEAWIAAAFFDTGICVPQLACTISVFAFVRQLQTVVYPRLFAPHNTERCAGVKQQSAAGIVAVGGRAMRDRHMEPDEVVDAGDRTGTSRGAVSWSRGEKVKPCYRGHW